MEEESLEFRIKRLEENIKRDKEKSKKFWIDEYPSYTMEQRIHHWAGAINQQIRWNEESGVSWKHVFSKKDYETIKSIEPNYDEFLPEICRIIRMNLEEIKRMYRGDDVI